MDRVVTLLARGIIAVKLVQNDFKVPASLDDSTRISEAKDPRRGSPLFFCVHQLRDRIHSRSPSVGGVISRQEW